MPHVGRAVSRKYTARQASGRFLENARQKRALGPWRARPVAGMTPRRPPRIAARGARGARPMACQPGDAASTARRAGAAPAPVTPLTLPPARGARPWRPWRPPVARVPAPTSPGHGPGARGGQGRTVPHSDFTNLSANFSHISPADGQRARGQVRGAEVEGRTPRGRFHVERGVNVNAGGALTGTEVGGRGVNGR